MVFSHWVDQEIRSLAMRYVVSGFCVTDLLRIDHVGCPTIEFGFTKSPISEY